MLSIESFIRITKSRSKNYNPDTKRQEYVLVPKEINPENIELIRVNESNGNYHNIVKVYRKE